LPYLPATLREGHGAKPKKAGLDLRTAAATFAGGESGPVLVLSRQQSSRRC